MWRIAAFQLVWIACNSVLVLLLWFSMHSSQHHVLNTTILDPRSPCKDHPWFRSCSRRVHTHFSGIVTSPSIRVASSYDYRWPPFPRPHRHVHPPSIPESTMVIPLLGARRCPVAHLSSLFAGTPTVLQSVTERQLPTLSVPFLERVIFHLDLYSKSMKSCNVIDHVCWVRNRIRTHNLSGRAAVDLRLRPRGNWDRQTCD